MRNTQADGAPKCVLRSFKPPEFSFLLRSLEPMPPKRSVERHQPLHAISVLEPVLPNLSADYSIADHRLAFLAVGGGAGRAGHNLLSVPAAHSCKQVPDTLYLIRFPASVPALAQCDPPTGRFRVNGNQVALPRSP